MFLTPPNFPFRYAIMISCWNFVPDRRPSFGDLIEWFEKFIQDKTDYLDLNPLMVHNATYLQPIIKQGTANTRTPGERLRDFRQATFRR